MGSYKVKSPIRKDGKEYAPGDKIQLDDQQAFEARHALEDGPKVTEDPNTELDDDEEEALDSIRRSPDNLESGVDKFWQRADYGVSMGRPDSNKTEMEIEREPVMRKAEAKSQAAKASGQPKPPVVKNSAPAPGPVVPPAVRPAPAPSKK